MTHMEVLWYVIAITLTVALVLGVFMFVLSIPLGAERQRRQNEAADRDLEAHRARYPDGAIDATVNAALTEGRIGPKTVQRFIDRGWLDSKSIPEGPTAEDEDIARGERC